MIKHVLSILVALFLCSLTLSADLRSDCELLVDSAYSQAMSGNLPHAVAINMEGLQAVPEDSMAIRCEFYSCLLYCYHRLGDYEQALHYGELCLQFDEEQGDAVNLSASLGNLAGIYSSAGHHDIAIDYLERSIAIEQQLLLTDSTHTPKSMAIRKAMLGEVLLAKKQDLPRALALTQEALAIDESLGRRVQVGMRLAQMGNIYQAMGQAVSARQCTTEALAIARETNNRMTEVLCLLQLGRYEEAATISHQLGLRKQEYEACDRLYSQKKAAGQTAEALRWLERARTLHDEIMNEESQRQLTIAQVRYDSFRKEKQLLEQQQELQAKQARERTLIMLVSLALLIVLLLIIVVILLRHRKRAIEQSAAEKARQYSILSHDLKNPIVAQRNLLAQLYADYAHYSSEEVQQYLGQLLAAGDGQLDLLHNLQEMVQLNRKLRPIHPIRLDVSALLREAIADVQSAAMLKAIHFDVRAERMLVTADRDSLRTVFRNLLSNAIKFSPKGSTIEVGTIAPDKVFVRDHGIGMSEAQKQAILSATTQVQSTIGTEGESGTGLGLLLCRELLRLNNATLEIESIPEKGTTITCQI